MAASSGAAERKQGRGRGVSQREREKERGSVARFEQLQGVLVGQDSASRRWPATSREPPRSYSLSERRRQGDFAKIPLDFGVFWKV
jgi:hypothetical protein